VAKVQEKNPKVIACFFCKKVGHLKHDCIKYQKWIIKKSNVISIEDYMTFDQLQLIGYTNSDYDGCIDIRSPLQVTFF